MESSRTPPAHGGALPPPTAWIRHPTRHSFRTVCCRPDISAWSGRRCWWQFV